MTHTPDKQVYLVQFLLTGDSPKGFPSFDTVPRPVELLEKIHVFRGPLYMTRERLNKNSFRIKNACLKMTFRLLPWHPSLHYSHKMPIKGIQEEHIKEKVLKGETITTKLEAYTIV